MNVEKTFFSEGFGKYYKCAKIAFIAFKVKKNMKFLKWHLCKRFM